MGLFYKFGPESGPDRYSRNESDGQLFSGYDSDDGKTTWYDSNGDIDSITDTPDDD